MSCNEGLASRNIVIVGGGYGGFETFLNLSKKPFRDPNVKLILISKSNYFYHNIAAPRSLVDESLIPKICVPFDRILTKDYQQFIHGNVTSVSQNQLKYAKITDDKEDSEQVLDFEYLVLALGSKYGHPFNAVLYERDREISDLQQSFNQVKESRRVLVIGGGATGVELAGELATDYPEKKVCFSSLHLFGLKKWKNGV